MGTRFKAYAPDLKTMRNKGLAELVLKSIFYNEFGFHFESPKLLPWLSVSMDNKKREAKKPPFYEVWIIR
jgi:hypothetical protein